MRAAMKIILANKAREIKRIEFLFEGRLLRKANRLTATKGTVKKREKRGYQIRKTKEMAMTMAQLYDVVSDRLPLLTQARLNADARWAMNIGEIR